jgi:hypothetical protein
VVNPPDEVPVASESMDDNDDSALDSPTLKSSNFFRSLYSRLSLVLV